MLKKTLIRTLLLIPVVFVNGCFSKGWEAFIHADKNNWDETIVIGFFETLYECRAAAIIKLKEVSSVEAGDFECGYNCKYEKGQEIYRQCSDHGQ